PQARVEEHIPAGMVIVVVDVDFVPVPSPVAAARDVVIGDDPRRAVVKNDAARVIVNADGDIFAANVRITASWIAMAGFKAGALSVPVPIVRIVGIVPPLVLAVVVPIVAVVVVPVTVFLLAFVLAVIVAVVVAILREGSRTLREHHGQSSGKDSEHYF